jgi:hypothetical protein
MNNRDISPAQAQEWLRYNRAAGPQRLYSLARWVANTNGPLDQLDSTLESLDTLWAWFLDFMVEGLAGQISPDAKSDRDTSFDVTPTNGPADLAAEVLAEYTLQVIRQTHSDAEWSIYPHEASSGPMLFENEVGVTTRGEWYFLHALTGNLVLRALRGVPQALMATRLRDIVVKHLPSVCTEPLPGPGFMLRDALRFAGPVLEAPRFSKDQFDSPRPSTASLKAQPFDALALIHASGQWDERDLPPLDEAELTVLLADLDLVDPPQDLPGTLKSDDMQLVGLGGSLLIESLAAGGRLRSVAFEQGNADPVAYEMLTRRLRAFTSGRQLQIVRADDGSPI